MHPQYGIPQLYHDQMNIIGKHLWEMQHDPVFHKDPNKQPVPAISTRLEAQIKQMSTKPFGRHRLWHTVNRLPKWYKLAALKKRQKLTRCYLLQQPDWDDWKQSRH